ncbi:DUF305 domain-containing protein [Stenomitos frigidus]|nr:DUF305 domain-containing protein [Stenomitos frigidus]
MDLSVLQAYEAWSRERGVSSNTIRIDLNVPVPVAQWSFHQSFPNESYGNPEPVKRVRAYRKTIIDRGDRSRVSDEASAEPIAYNAQMHHSMPMSQDAIKSMMMSMDLGAADDQFDQRFLNAMIPHHEGAVVMAQDALKKSKRPEIQALARDIIRSQEAEIKQMKQWQQAWYKQ